MGRQAAVLTPAQLTQYGRQGFVLLRGLVDAGRLARYDARFLELAAGRATVPPALVIMRDIMVVKGAARPANAVEGVNKLFHFQDDPTLFDYAKNPAVLDVAARLVGQADGELGVIATNVFNKPPGVDGRHPLHQDLRYFRLRPADGIVGAWTALSACERRTGCLAVVPGSHRGPLLRHGAPDWEYVNHAFLGAEGAASMQRTHIEMRPGDTLFFHPLLIHGSGQNRGDGCRRAISAHFAAARCEAPDEDWRAAPHVRMVTPPSA